MLLDNQTLFCEKQKITTGTQYSVNIVAFGKNDVSFAPVLVQVVKDFTNLTDLKVIFQTASTAEFSDVTDLAQASLKLAELKAGKTFPITFLPKGNKGFMRLCFIPSGTTETTGEITSGVVAGQGLQINEI